MNRLIQAKSKLEMGEFLNKWFHNRTVERNQNAIIVTTGGTGSGKSYTNLSMANLWYIYRFNEEFPLENICFSLGDLMKRIMELSKSGKLRKGELFILEEAGANFGNLEFQSKISRMFNYILQSFRSMNLILLMNLPVFTAVNKTARDLVHAQFNTCGIDHQNKIAKIKPYFHQQSQKTGKSYWKFPRIKVNGKTVVLERLNFPKPPESLSEPYEEKKFKFVTGLADEFIEEYDKQKVEAEKKKKPYLTDAEMEVFNYLQQGKTISEIANIKDVNPSSISRTKDRILQKGFKLQKYNKNEVIVSGLSGT